MSRYLIVNFMIMSLKLNKNKGNIKISCINLKSWLLCLIRGRGKLISLWKSMRAIIDRKL